MKHPFTEKIFDILAVRYGTLGKIIFENSQLLQYVNNKTKSANKGSKSRGSFASLYAIYVLVEDYLSKKFDMSGDYSKYDGAEFSRLLERMRQLPFGAKIQNHALNNRVVSEFTGMFSTSEYVPILRDQNTNKYWINENLLKVVVNDKDYNIAQSLIEIIDAYVEAKTGAFERFIQSCLVLQKLERADYDKIEEFILCLLKPEVDARLFEIVSYSILKYYYRDTVIFWGFERHCLNEERLTLYKTGRTNANDGGIDFVMKPLGRFFQVTETLDVKKYFLDIDKIQRYPITFVVKSEIAGDELLGGLRANALKSYSVEAIVEIYMKCIEEVINIPTMKQYLKSATAQGYLTAILNEIVLQSRVEFNYLDSNEVSMK